MDGLSIFSPNWAYLDIDISSTVDQELQTQGTMGGRSSKVERCEALVIWLTNISTIVDQLADHCVLPIKTRHMQRCVPKRIGFIYLRVKRTM